MATPFLLLQVLVAGSIFTLQDAEVDRKTTEGITLIGSEVPVESVQFRGVEWIGCADRQELLGYKGNEIFLAESSTFQQNNRKQMECDRVVSCCYVGSNQVAVLGVSKENSELEISGLSDSAAELATKSIPALDRYFLFMLNRDLEIERKQALPRNAVVVDATGVIVEAFHQLVSNGNFIAAVGDQKTLIFDSQLNQIVGTKVHSGGYPGRMVFLNDEAVYFEGARNIWQFGGEEQSEKNVWNSKVKDLREIVDATQDCSTCLFEDRDHQYWLLKNGKLKELELQGMNRPSLSPDGKLIAAMQGNEKGTTLRVLKIEDFSVVNEVELTALDLHGIRLLTTDRCLISSSGFTFSVAVDKNMNETVSRITNMLPRANKLNFYEGNQKLLVNSNVEIDVELGHVVFHRWAVEGWLFKFLPSANDKKIAYFKTNDGKTSLRLLDLTTGEVRVLKIFSKMGVVNQLLKTMGSDELSLNWQPPPLALQFANDGKRLAVAVLEAGDGILFSTIDLESESTSEKHIQVNEQFRFGAPVSISPNLKFISYFDNQNVVVHDIEESTNFRIPTSVGGQSSFSFDDRFLAVQDGDNCRIWDIQSQRKVALFEQVSFFAFSQNSDVFFASHRENEVDIVHKYRWKDRQKHKSGNGDIISATVSADGSMISFGLSDSRVEIWDVDTIFRQ